MTDVKPVVIEKLDFKQRDETFIVALPTTFVFF